MIGYAPDVICNKVVVEEGMDFINKPFNKNELLKNTWNFGQQPYQIRRRQNLFSRSWNYMNVNFLTAFDALYRRYTPPL
jgi:hypothetical protein